MKHSPTISIVTPSFNQSAFIQEALLSVKNQSYQPLEHVVVDGQSSDDTIKILGRLSWQSQWSHLHWISEPDNGQSHALNKGFARAQGDIVGWLNSDDRYLPDCFEQVAATFLQHPEVDILYGDYRWIDEAGRVCRLRREIEFSRFILLHHRVLFIPTTATFFRRRVFEERHFIDEGLHYALDFEFFVRLAAHGYRFLHLPAILADFRLQSASKTCSAPHKQLEEKDAVTQSYSPLLARLQSPQLRRAAFVLLRSAAAALRYSEKLVRGYYLEQLRFNGARF